jgi:hypothetical protein
VPWSWPEAIAGLRLINCQTITSARVWQRYSCHLRFSLGLTLESKPKARVHRLKLFSRPGALHFVARCRLILGAPFFGSGHGFALPRLPIAARQAR